MKPWFFVAFNITISHIFPENFTEIPQVIQKIWRTSLSILVSLLSEILAGRKFRGFAIFLLNRKISFREFLKFFDQLQNLLLRNSDFENLEISIQCFCNINDNTACFQSRIWRECWNSWIKGLAFIGDYRKAMTRKYRGENEKTSKKEDKKAKVKKSNKSRLNLLLLL